MRHSFSALFAIGLFGMPLACVPARGEPTASPPPAATSSLANAPDAPSAAPSASAASSASSAASAPGVSAKDAGPAGGSACAKDSDCRTFADYCTGCLCRSLLVSAPDPKCSGPGVRCFADPCMKKHATCVKGACSLADESASPM